MNCEVDLQKVYTLGRYDGSKIIAPYVYPTDESMTAMRDSTPMRNGDGTFVPHHCAYCMFRPLAPPEIPPGHQDHWKYGTGDGAHNSWRCQALRRYLAEGGICQKDANGAAVIRAGDPVVKAVRACVVIKTYNDNRRA